MSLKIVVISSSSYFFLLVFSSLGSSFCGFLMLRSLQASPSSSPSSSFLPLLGGCSTLIWNIFLSSCLALWPLISSLYPRHFFRYVFSLFISSLPFFSFSNFCFQAMGLQFSRHHLQQPRSCRFLDLCLIRNHPQASAFFQNHNLPICPWE
jgi:hypothetical protein